MKDRTSRPPPAGGILGWPGLALLLALPAAVGAQTAVRSASPTALRLEAGGRGAEVTVQGSGLDQVGSIEATLSGRVHGGVRARILRAGSTELVVGVEAGADAAPARGIRLVLVTARQRVEVVAEIELVAAVPVAGPLKGSASTPGADTLSVGEPTGAAPEAPGETQPPGLEPVSAQVGAFVATIADPWAALPPPEAVSVAAGAFAAVIADPAAPREPPEPVTLDVGTFVVVIAPPGGGI